MIYKNGIKRMIDIVVALLGMPLFLLVFVIFAPIIYCSDRGRVFYVAPRLGKNGKSFSMYKFRSMKVNAPDIRNADGSTFNSKNDPRLTKIGKFMRQTSLDEAPQLLNILRGDMSIIGPRPDLPEAKELYDAAEQRKLEVRPGITGYSQAYYRNSVNAQTKWENDIYYVDHISFIFDMKIFFKTVLGVFSRKNVFVGPEITTESHDSRSVKL